MPSRARAEENGKTSSCPPSCQPPSSVRGTETRRHSAGWTQTLPSVTVLLVSPLSIQEGELNETKPLLLSGAATLSLHKVPHAQRQRRTGTSFRSWHGEVAQPWAPAHTGRAVSRRERQEPYSSTGVQAGCIQRSPSPATARLPPPRDNRWSREAMGDGLNFNDRNTGVQEVMERAECYKQPILARSWRALQAKTRTVFCQQ